MRKSSGEKTRYPGVYRLGAQRHRITGKLRDPKTGRLRQVERILDGVTAQEAAARRREILAGAATPMSSRRRVKDVADSWLVLKAPTIDPLTLERYERALELVDGLSFGVERRRLGEMYADAVQPEDVQGWVNALLAQGKAVETVRGWFRAFRTMARDRAGDFRGDPTVRVAFPDTPERKEANALTEEQLAAFLLAMQTRYPQHFALAVVLVVTGLRFCHASALRWEDLDELAGVVRVERKNTRKRIGPVSRKKRAPKAIGVDALVFAVMKEHRARLVETQAPGLEAGYCFPDRDGGLRRPGGLSKAWAACLAAAAVTERFTVHGMRRTFNDVLRRGGSDGKVIQSIAGWVTEKMRGHYSTVRHDEQRTATGMVAKLVPFTPRSLDRGMDQDAENKTAG